MTLFIAFNVTAMIATIIIGALMVKDQKKVKPFDLIVAESSAKLAHEKLLWTRELHAEYERIHGKTMYSTYSNILHMMCAFSLWGDMDVSEAVKNLD